MSRLSKERKAKLVAECNALPMHSGDPSPAENSESLPLDDVAAKINREHAAVKEALQESVCHAEAAGRLLIAAKARLDHGQWGEWIDTNCEFSERTAQAYMRVARELKRLDPAKAQRVADLPLRQVLDEISGHLIVGTPAGWSVALPKAVSEEQTIYVSSQKVSTLHPEPSCLPPAREDEAEPMQIFVASEPRDDTPTEPVTITFGAPTSVTWALENLLGYIRYTDLDQAKRAMEMESISAQDMEELSSWAADMAISLQRTD